MRIDKLTLTNYKCFENETFSFNPHFNVIIGKNAAGKTSLLDAISKIASGYIHGIVAPAKADFIEDGEIRTLILNGQPKPQIPVHIKAQIGLHYQKLESVIAVEHRIVREEEGRYNVFLSSRNHILDLIRVARNDLRQSRMPAENVKFPLIVYYGTGRLWKQQGDVNGFKQTEGVFSGYKDCLNPQASASYFLSWYKTFEYDVYQNNQPDDDLKLKVFKSIISAMVPSWTDIGYRRSYDDLMGKFKDESGNENLLPFSSLSDGYRNMIGMVADMAYRCIQLNPGLRENVITETEGIVLIDEIDLHLHPEWQKNIVADLKRVFPKIQFIVTTHSPFIVQSLTKEELIILDKEEPADKDPWRKSLEEVAEDEMLVSDVERSNRFKEMTEIAKEYFTLVKQNDSEDSLREKIDNAKFRLDKLRVLYSDDPAYVAMLETELEKNELNAPGN